MKRYFEIRTKEGFKNGMIENIPENTPEHLIAERVEVNENGEEIKIVEENDVMIDIVFDWVSLDFDAGIDENLIIVDDVLQASIDLGIEDKVVFTALSMIKKDSKIDIAIAMQDSFKKLTE